MQDLKTIQTKLNDDFFSTTKETCLTSCRIQDITKKSKDKMYILCACSKYMNFQQIIVLEYCLQHTFTSTKQRTDRNDWITSLEEKRAIRYRKNICYCLFLTEK